ncbi:hypothetical protein NDU88_001491 [Pleurodeles waltl]|uniref:Uncharacterized protein n=1 Tax=Pleurodeles waltl TaxID=8319 RepID=A0AAV7SAL2_PLEWA|nr:hypothetical protein NDU88_001491 [Pleurodeles waltl]
MESEKKVLEAVALLRQAGRLDLLKEGALAPTRLARRASAGVAAAGPHALRHGVQRTARVFRAPGRTGRRSRLPPAKKWGVGPRGAAEQQALVEGQVGAREPSAGYKGKEKAAGVLGERLGGARPRKLKTAATGASVASEAFYGPVFLPSGGRGKGAVFGSGDLGSSSGVGQSGIFEKQEAEGDPKIPLSKKWPTMLQWSSDEEGDDLGGDMGRVGGGSTPVVNGILVLPLAHQTFLGRGSWTTVRRTQASRTRLECTGEKRRRALGRPAGYRHQDGAGGTVGLRMLLLGGVEERALHPPSPRPRRSNVRARPDGGQNREGSIPAV